MVTINEHLRATAKPSVHHEAGYSTVVINQPVQPVSGIVFEKEFFDEMNTNSDPATESSLQSSDDTHIEENDSARESASVRESDSQKNTSSGPRYSFSTEIPETYDDFYLCVLPRDPDMLYVYWELPDGTRSEKHNFQEQAPSKEQLVLRVKGQTIDNNVTHVNNSYDVPIQKNAADSYVHVPTGACQCSVECGIVNERGYFRPYTPPDQSHNHSIETTPFYASDTIEYQHLQDEYCSETAPVSVGSACVKPVAESYRPADINNGSAPFVRTIDLPVVKLDTKHYLGSATPA